MEKEQNNILRTENKGIEILSEVNLQNKNEQKNSNLFIEFNEQNRNYSVLAPETASSFEYKNIESDSPRSRFIEIYQSVDKAEVKILELESRRKLLEKDMELLLQEMQYEKLMLREAAGFEIDQKIQITPRNHYSSIKKDVINPLNISHDNIKTHIEECRKILNYSKSQSNITNEPFGPDLKYFKTNLENYKRELSKFSIDYVQINAEQTCPIENLRKNSNLEEESIKNFSDAKS